MTAVQIYQYTDLPAGDSIRYLTLLPGAGDEPLRCKLHVTSMADADFEAMSYVWGSDDRNQQIFCDDYPFQVTTNLFNVLKRVRRPDSERNLWADLVCINQENLDEKSEQVAIMGQIYRKASQVLILMGLDDHGQGENVCSLIGDVNTLLDHVLSTITWDWNTFPHPDKDEPLLTDPRWDSMKVLLQDNWFTRGWVVREAGFAQDARVYWGHFEFSWEKLMRTLNWLYHRATYTLYSKTLDKLVPLAHLEVYEDRHPTYAKLFSTELVWVEHSLLGYLNLTRLLNLKDPRDRIYAFLELVQSEEKRFHLRPNYKDNFLHVYQEFAIEYIRATESMSLLNNVEHNEESLHAGIPSWVPRWDLPLTLPGFSFAPAESGYKPLTSRNDTVEAPAVMNPDTLYTRGVVFDSVIYASDVLKNTSTTPNTISNIWNAILARKEASPYTERYFLYAFLGVLTACTREGDLHEWLASEATYYKELFEKSGSPAAIFPPFEYAGQASAQAVHHTIQGYTHYRKIVLTKRGYLGLAPAVVCEGDLCGIVFGSTTPSILRPVNSGEDVYQYLGAAYIPGRNGMIMRDGRAVFMHVLGSFDSKEWIQWDVEEQDINFR